MARAFPEVKKKSGLENRLRARKSRGGAVEGSAQDSLSISKFTWERCLDLILTVVLLRAHFVCGDLQRSHAPLPPSNDLIHKWQKNPKLGLRHPEPQAPPASSDMSRPKDDPTSSVLNPHSNY